MLYCTFIFFQRSYIESHGPHSFQFMSMPSDQVSSDKKLFMVGLLKFGLSFFFVFSGNLMRGTGMLVVINILLSFHISWHVWVELLCSSGLLLALVLTGVWIVEKKLRMGDEDSCIISGYKHPSHSRCSILLSFIFPQFLLDQNFLINLIQYIRPYHMSIMRTCHFLSCNKILFETIS